MFPPGPVRIDWPRPNRHRPVPRRYHSSSAVPFRPKTQFQTSNSPPVILRLSSGYPPVNPLLPRRSAISARTARPTRSSAPLPGAATPPSPVSRSEAHGDKSRERSLTHPFLVPCSNVGANGQGSRRTGCAIEARNSPARSPSATAIFHRCLDLERRRPPSPIVGTEARFQRKIPEGQAGTCEHSIRASDADANSVRFPVVRCSAIQ